MASIYPRWTEAELQTDIARLGKLIAQTRRRGGHSPRCAVAYLTQVLRDRRDSLAGLQVVKRNRLD